MIMMIKNIMSMGWQYVSELQPPTALLFILQVIYEYGQPWWNDIDRFRLGRRRWIFEDKKDSSTTSFKVEVKPSVSCRDFSRHIKSPFEI
jgi:hypothetical protein